MKYLNFERDFIEMIVDGRKRSTIRLGRKEFFPGEVVEITADGEHIGYAEIESVEVRRWSEFTEEDAVLDGFESLEALRDALERFYGPFGDDEEFTRITFRLLFLDGEPPS